MINRDYKKFPTTEKVWDAIRLAHPDMGLFSTFTAMDGSPFVTPGTGAAMTEWGFRDGDFPVIGARTTWDIDWENDTGRSNEKTAYWLCVGIKEEK